MSRAREVSKVTATVASLSASVADFDAVAYSSASPSGAQTGDLWVDTSTANPLIKAYDGTTWDTLGSAPVPIITGIAPDNIAGTASTAVIINGSNFESGSIVKLIDTTNTELFTLSTTFNNSRSLQFLTPALTASAGPYDIKVTNPDNQLSILENVLTVGQSTVWQTASGSLGEIYDSGRANTTFSLLAIDPDNQQVTYQIINGNLPTGMSLSSGGSISGTAQSVSSDTTYSFTVRATDIVGNYADRSFSITTKAPVIQQFTANGSTSWQSPTSSNIQVLVVGGGGGGGSTISNSSGGAGGGAGGFIYNSSYPVIKNTSYLITIGAGGNGGTGGSTTEAWGKDGANSVFDSLISIGGGGGGSGSQDTSAKSNGRNGGSGGGAGNTGGAGSPGSGTLNQGFSGGNNGGGSGNYGCGGGGGAGGAGGNATTTLGGNGGSGVSNSITGSSVTYAGGGGGGTYNGGTPGTGGSGIGGRGGTSNTQNPTNGVTNTGSGGGGTSGGAGIFTAGNGGSGIVIIRY